MSHPRLLVRISPYQQCFSQPLSAGLRHWSQRQSQRVRFATTTAATTRPKRKAGRWIFATLLIGTTGYVTLTDNGKFGWQVAQRSTRVLTTLAANIYDYRKTIPQSSTLPPAEYEVLLKACHQRCADRTLVTMEKNGSVFIKLGQHLTSLNYMLPSEWCDTFIPLQDRCPVSSFESVKELVEHDTGKHFEELFSSFEEQPIGSASLAQVHRAVDLQSGQKVAVKIQHPELDYWAPIDMKLTSFTFKTIKRFFPEYDLTWLSDEMEYSLPKELDFICEGENAGFAREYFSHVKNTPLVVPQVFWAARRICVMEYVTGHRIDDLNYIDSNHISRDEVAAALARVFNTMIFRPGAPLHCDPHFGNVAVALNNTRRYPHNFDIVLYDHGLYRRIPTELQRSYAKLWLAVLDADEPRMRRYAHEVAGITDEQFPLFASAITGRDYRVVTQNVSRISQSEEERKAISEALEGGMLQELIKLLGKMPRIILLILKTNDLTRSLEVNLQTRYGPIHSFLILARYAAQTVFDEQLELLRHRGSLLWPTNTIRLFSAWTEYARVEVKLGLYEWYMWYRSLMGLSMPMTEQNSIPRP